MTEIQILFLVTYVLLTPNLQDLTHWPHGRGDLYFSCVILEYDFLIDIVIYIQVNATGPQVL